MNKEKLLKSKLKMIEHNLNYRNEIVKNVLGKINENSLSDFEYAYNTNTGEIYYSLEDILLYIENDISNLEKYILEDL